MKTIDIQVRDKNGIHLRVASAIVRKIKEYNSRIFISKGSQQARGDSILELLLLEATENSQIKVTAEGSDEQQAIQGIGEFFIDGAGI